MASWPPNDVPAHLRALVESIRYQVGEPLHGQEGTSLTHVRQ
jgi:hypothetical protein